MKGFWIIVILIVVLIPLFMFSIDKDKKNVEMRDKEGRMTVPDIVDDTIYESASIFRMHMKSLDEYDDALAESIESQNWDDICKYAMLLKNTSPLLFTGKIRAQTSQPPIEINNAVPQKLNEITLGLLEEDPSNRIPSAEKLRDELASVV